jgi:hypothetical protein
MFIAVKRGKQAMKEILGVLALLFIFRGVTGVLDGWKLP